MPWAGAAGLIVASKHYRKLFEKSRSGLAAL
jgi:hypothetical protein